MVLGVGAMVGAGIFVLTGQAAATEAGPITLSFALAGVLYLRSADRTPLSPAVPILAILGCLHLAVTLPADTWIRFGVWMVLRLVVYVVYARGSSRVGEDRARESSWRSSAIVGPGRSTTSPHVNAMCCERRRRATSRSKPSRVAWKR